MTQLTFSLHCYRKICFKFCILEQIIGTVLFICISSINNKRSLLRLKSTTASTNRGWSAYGLEDKFLFYFFAAFSITKKERKTAHRHVFLRMVGEVEMSCNWFGSVFIINLNIPKVFAETITQSAARFADVYFLHKVQVRQ